MTEPKNQSEIDGQQLEIPGAEIVAPKTEEMPAAPGESAEKPPAASVPKPRKPPAKPRPSQTVMLPRRKAVAILAATAAAGLVLGAAVMFLANGYRYKWMDARDKLIAAESKLQALDSENEKSRIELSNLRLGMSQMNKVFAEENKPPEKPNYVKLDKGILVYWMDGMLWRHYYLYKAQGNGSLAKTSSRSTRKNFVFLSDVKPGVWNYAVTALDRQGRETEFSETLTIKVSK